MKKDNKPDPGVRRNKARIILHIDMNAFYCSVHEAVEPEKYRGRPIAVSGSEELRRGIIVTASYPARAKGVRTGMQVREARKCCPELVFIQPDFHLYRRYSTAFMRIVEQYTPLVEPVSIDECYADITGSSQFGEPLEIAETVQRRIREELDLPCSVGLAPNKLLAKMASDFKKPNGLTILRIRDVPRLLWDKPCQELFGIGRSTADKLLKLGIKTIGELAKADETRLREAFGVTGEWLKQAANGIDHSPVSADQEASKSIGHTTTLPWNFREWEDIRRVFLNLADQVARRLRKQDLVAATVQIAIRDPAMKTISRSVTLPTPTDLADDIFQEACRLFRKSWPEKKEVRLLGITLQNLQDKRGSAQQLDLFDFREQPRKASLTRIMDELRDKFGEDAVLTAGMLSDDPSAKIRDHKRRGTSLQKDHLKRKDED